MRNSHLHLHDSFETFAVTSVYSHSLCKMLYQVSFIKLRFTIPSYANVSGSYMSLPDEYKVSKVKQVKV